MNIALERIRRDGGTQPRAAIDYGIVEEYAQAMGDGAVFPPVVVFFDGTDYWLADGFHRCEAHAVCGLVDIDCDVRQGTVRDAILHSVGVNAAHGMRRTNADKRRSVMRLLEDPEWSQWPNRQIARQCAVSLDMVNRHRDSMAPQLNETFSAVPRPARVPDAVAEKAEAIRSSGGEPRYYERGGRVQVMDTARIGSNSPPVSEVERIQALGASRERAEQIVRDNAHGWISAAVREIERQMAVLPDDPVEAARKFPVGHRHALNINRLFQFAEWFGEFAEEMRNIERAPNVAAE